MKTPKIAGIYKITIGTHVYIGQAVDIKARWRTHLCELRNSYHRNKKVQNAFNKYGESNTAFSVLLTVSTKDLEHHQIKQLLCITEQTFFNIYNPDLNMKPSAESNLGHKWGEDSRNKISVDRSKPFLLISPTGKIIEGRGLKQFCLDRGFDQATMQKVLRGVHPSYKGYTNCFENYLKIKYYGSASKLISKPEYIIKEGDAYVTKVINRNRFCKQRNLLATSLNAVVKGRHKRHKGWRLATKEQLASLPIKLA